MPYKIVQTTEGEAVQLTVVPAFWENNGVLKWPPKTLKYAAKLIRDENSQPGPGWSEIDCNLKRTNIKSHEEANMELKRMQEYTDTDCNENEYSYASRSAVQQSIVDFDALAHNLSFSQPGPEKNYIDPAQRIVQLDHETSVQLITSENSDTMLSSQTLILNKLENIIENQKRIAHKLASLSVQLENTNEKVRQLSDLYEGQPPQNVTLLKDASQEELESFSFQRIENKEQFDVLEASLADKRTRQKFANKFAFLYSPMPGEGRTCAYKLIDVMFASDFLCQCSWSGGSKGEISKIPMKNYVSFRKLFFYIIHTWDSSFTDNEMLKFFKLVLRNANKRKGMRGLRASAKRSRFGKKAKVSTKPDVPKDNDDSGSTQPLAHICNVTDNENNGMSEGRADGEISAVDDVDLK